MSEERTKILQMLSDGKITADEAATLLDASFSTTDTANAVTAVVSDISSNISLGVEPIVVHEDEFVNDDRAKRAPRRGFLGGWTNWANNLEGIRCDGAIFNRAFFLANNLDHANFCDADAEAAKFFAVNVDRANFEGANLRGARILCSNLDKANFRNANLEGVTIFGSNFDSANFEGADLRGQSFVAANMDGFNAKAKRTVDVEPNETLVLDGPVSHV